MSDSNVKTSLHHDLSLTLVHFLPFLVKRRVKCHGHFFQVLVLFFLFVMAFSSTFYLLMDEETVRFL